MTAPILRLTVELGAGESLVEAELPASTAARDLEIAVLERRGHAGDFLTSNAVASRNGPPR